MILSSISKFTSIITNKRCHFEREMRRIFFYDMHVSLSLLKDFSLSFKMTLKIYNSEIELQNSEIAFTLLACLRREGYHLPGHGAIWQ